MALSVATGHGPLSLMMCGVYVALGKARRWAIGLWTEVRRTEQDAVKVLCNPRCITHPKRTFCPSSACMPERPAGRASELPSRKEAQNPCAETSCASFFSSLQVLDSRPHNVVVKDGLGIVKAFACNFLQFHHICMACQPVERSLDRSSTGKPQVFQEDSGT